MAISHSKILIMISLVIPTITGCQTSSGISGSIDRASHQISRSLKSSYQEIHAKPVMLLTRETPCECDSDLKYEIEVSGQWRHVKVTGEESALAWLRNESQKHPAGTPFEALYLIKNDIFTSIHGQKFYTFEVISVIK